MKTIELHKDALQSYRAKALELGIDSDHNYIFDALHDEARETVQVLLGAGGIDAGDLDCDQLSTLIEAYKEGFWEPTHLDERRALKEQIATLTAALADKFVAESAEDIRFPGMFVPRVPTLSTAHITKEDGDRLQHNYIPALIGRSPDGAILHIGESDDDPEEEFAEFSEAFRNIVLRLKEAGYNYVRFDNAQENIPAFPTFDW